MGKLIINFLLLMLFSVFAIFSFRCSDRGMPTKNEDQLFSTGVDSLTDIDGNIYHTVWIGSQLWMVENLRVTRYRNGDTIANISDNKTWATLSTGAYCTYEDEAENAEVYGLLYNWHAVNDSRKITPAGWRIPSDEDWRILIETLGGSSVAGGKIKDDKGWFDNGNGSNSSKFSALPAGVRGSNGLFSEIGYGTSFWSSSEISTDAAWGRWVNYVSPGIGRDDANRLDGFSVRCLRGL